MGEFITTVLCTLEKVKSRNIEQSVVFVAFVESNATMSSICYFENNESYFCAKLKEVDPIKLLFYDKYVL